MPRSSFAWAAHPKVAFSAPCRCYQGLEVFSCLVTVTATVLLLSIHCFGNWRSLSGPVGAECSQLVATRGRVLARTNAGIYASDDTARTWHLSNSGLRSLYGLSALASNDSLVVAGTSAGTVYVSTNKGDSWGEIGGPASVGIINAIGLIGSTIVACGSRIWISSDFGATWEDRSSGLPSPAVYSLAIGGDRNSLERSILYVGLGKTVLSTDTTGVYRSLDGGLSWTRIDSTSGWHSYLPTFVLFENKGTLFMYKEQSEIYSTTDSGNTWQLGDRGMFYETAFAFAATGDTLFCATRAGVTFRSTNNGSLWSPFYDGLDGSTLVTLSTIGKTVIGGASRGMEFSMGSQRDDGIYVSRVDSAGWRASNAGLVNTSVLSISTTAETVVCALAGGGVGVLDRYKGIWTRPLSGLADPNSQNAQRVFCVQSGPYAGDVLANFTAQTSHGTSVALWRLRYGDTAWIPSDEGIPSGALVTSIALDTTSHAEIGGDLYAGTIKGVVRSTDGGWHWDTLPGANTNDGSLDIAVLHGEMNGQKRIYANGYYGFNFSTDGGARWHRVVGPFGDSAVNALQIHKGQLYLATKSTLYRRASDTEFVVISAPSGGIPRRLQSVGNLLFALDMGSGLAFSRDGGITWTSQDVGLPGITTRSAAVQDSVVYVGTSGIGAWARPYGELDSTSEVILTPRTAIPDDLALYPNPGTNMSGVRTVTVPLKALEISSLHVFDQLGRPVAASWQEIPVAVGRALQFTLHGVAAGAYTIVLRSAWGAVWTQKFLVIQ